MKHTFHRRTLKLILCLGILSMLSSTAHSQSSITEKQKQEAIKAKLQLNDCIAHVDTLCMDLNAANLYLSEYKQKVKRKNRFIFGTLLAIAIKEAAQALIK
jgi:hypothetical protein